MAPFVPFSTVSELLSSRYQITTIANTAFENDFKGVKSGIYQDLWREKFLDPDKSFTEDHKDGLEIINEDLYTLYTDYHTATSYAEVKECRFKITEALGPKGYLSFAFPKKSPLRDIFNDHLHHMLESGEIMRIITKNLESLPACAESRGKPLGFENIAIVFGILLVGVFLSFLLGLAEIFPVKK